MVSDPLGDKARHEKVVLSLSRPRVARETPECFEGLLLEPGGSVG
jgi:hypothetical protein